MPGKKPIFSSVLPSHFSRKRDSDAMLSPTPDTPDLAGPSGTASDPINVDSDSGDSDVQYVYSDPSDAEDDDLHAAIVASLKEKQQYEWEARHMSLAVYGKEGWVADTERCKASLGAKGEVEGYAGMVGMVTNIHRGESQNSIKFGLQYEDMDGRESKFALEMSFRNLNTYPKSYTVQIFSHDKLPRRAEKSFLRFANCYDLDLPRLIARLVASLQGDDEATGGEMRDESDEDEDEGMEEAWVEDTEKELLDGHQGGDVPAGWTMLKTHFEQAIHYGFRPGLTRVSDFWVISYSIPLKNIAIDPNTLAMWDDDLVGAWHDNQRFQLLMGVVEYPPNVNNIRYWIGLHKDYKPPLDVVIQTTRGSGLPHFYLSGPLLSFLRAFPRCFALRTTYNLDWATADCTGIDQNTYQEFVRTTRPMKVRVQAEKTDPVAKGWADNIPLCAFHWVLRRFVQAPRYCLNCGLEVETISLRPYVCAKPLCLYGFLSLGLGPSVEHTIQTHPGVVDLLLSYAHCAASSSTRMDMPTHLNIEIPPAFGYSHKPLLFDELPDTPATLVTKGPKPAAAKASNAPDRRFALVWLITKLPRVSEIKAHLDAGGKLNHLPCPTGSIGVLRWVVGSCRAYLKEVKPGEAVLNDMALATVNVADPGGQKGTPAVRQFLFVVGSPEQETNFRGEIVNAQKWEANCKKFPTLLAFHGSAANRWHNILRTGLDYEEVANARSYGHGVYFSAEASTSMNHYAAGATMIRSNADFVLSRSTALVELVNVPKTFVSNKPYYVVNNTKQIKPFLLIVTGTIADPDLSVDADGLGSAEDAVKAVLEAQAAALASQAETLARGQKRVRKRPELLFQHDPKLPMKTTFYAHELKVMMPAKLERTTFEDTSPNDATDQKILHPPLPPAPVKIWKPTLHARLREIQIMPPPAESAMVASKALGKEFKALVKAQGEGKLPFYVDPGGDSLYSWMLELHDFPASDLKKDLAKHKIPSIIAEIRFPASFPYAPPFMRIIHPRCLPFTQGGGGNITGGGSVCNEILTASGWNPAFCVEAIVRDIMVNMTEATPPARLHPTHWNKAYTMPEAVAAYVRAAEAHGWVVPKDFKKVASGVIPSN